MLELELEWETTRICVGFTQAKFAEKGTEIAELQFSQMQSQLDTFRSNLEEFAAKHKNEIKKNAEFRQHFQQMCARIGVDPLACKYLGLSLFIYQSVLHIHEYTVSASKGFWAEMLGVGDFYYEASFLSIR